MRYALELIQMMDELNAKVSQQVSSTLNKLNPARRPDFPLNVNLPQARDFIVPNAEPEENLEISHKDDVNIFTSNFH